MPVVEFYRDASEREPVAEYIRELNRSRPADAATLVRYMELLRQEGHLIRPPVSAMIDRRERIFELRAGNYRIAYALHAGSYVLLHAWRKKTQKLDQRQLKQ